MADAAEPLDNVTVRTSGGDLVMPWGSRQALIKQFKHLSVFNPIWVAFHAAGASQPVRLTWEQKRDLVDLIHLWRRRTADGFDGLPQGMHELWNALRAEVHSTADPVDGADVQAHVAFSESPAEDRELADSPLKDEIAALRDEICVLRRQQAQAVGHGRRQQRRA